MPLDQQGYKPDTQTDVYPKVRYYADRIDKEVPETKLCFDCWLWTDEECGTRGCIAGWVIHFEGGKDPNLPYSTQGSRHMGLDEHISYQLFFPPDDKIPDKAQVLRTMRHLARTGHVNWTV